MVVSIIDKIVTDLPFGKQWSSVQENEVLYPRALAELARVVRCGGTAVVLTSAENMRTMQAALATVVPTAVHVQEQQHTRRRDAPPTQNPQAGPIEWCG